MSAPLHRATPGPTNRPISGTRRVLDAARQAEVRRVVFAASARCRGRTRAPQCREEGAEPLSPYAGRSSRPSVLRLHPCGLETVTLRYFNVFGPRQDPGRHYAAVIPLFISAPLAGESAPLVHGDGEQTRDFVHVDDVVRANLAAPTRPRRRGPSAQRGQRARAPG